MLGIPNIERKFSSLRLNSSSEALSAFRTITMMLHYIQERKQSFNDPRPKDQRHRRELRILNALATLLVRSNEVVAIVALPQADHNVHRMELVASTQADSMPNDSLAPNGDHPIIINPEHKHSEGDVTLTPDKFINAIRGEITFEEHTQLISRLLISSKQRDAMTLTKYIIAACARKISSRLRNPNYSKPFSRSLRDVSNFVFRHTPQITLCIGDPAMDRVLVHKTLPFLKPLLSHDYSHFIKICTSSGDENDDIYNKDTCVEFHRLLCELIEKFEGSLNTLLASWDPKRTQTTNSKNSLSPDDPLENSPTATSTTNPGNSPSLDRHLENVVFIGSTLHRLARGAAIEKHLRVIESLLTHCSRVDTVELREKEVEGDGNEDDDALAGIQPYTVLHGTPMALWESYREWLKLMVVHFDAIAIVGRYVADSALDKITIKILVTPKVDDKMLTWEQLLRSSHFPNAESDAVPPERKLVDNNAIIAFLKRWADPEKNCSNAIQNVVHTARELYEKGHDPIPVTSIDALVKQMRVADCKSPGWKEYRNDMISITESLKECDSREDWHDSITDILYMLEALMDSSLLYRKLRPGTPLSAGEGFGGTYHCELVIAIFIALARTPGQTGYVDILKELRGAGPVIGVSKRCCPLCDAALKLLSPDKPFICGGTHAMLWGCALPPWLPTDYVGRLNAIFGAQLRHELIAVMQTPSIRERNDSSGSQRLSLDTLRKAPILEFYSANKIKILKEL